MVDNLQSPVGLSCVHTELLQGTATVTLTYDAVDRRTSLTLPNSVIIQYGRDDDSRLTSLTYSDGSTTLGGLTYAYDAAGRRTSVGGSFARTGLPAALASATYDDANQIAAFGGVSFTYDDNGNLTSDGVRSYTWDERNQLTAISGGVSAGFGYDGLGRRRSRTVGGVTRGFLYDGLNPVQELGGGSPVANLLTGLGIDEYFTRTDGAGTVSYLTDALGSTVALADGSAAVQTEYTYEPFGGTSVSGTSTGNSFGFTGREDDGTGLYFYRARYYDPRLQRFVAEDPIEFRGGDVNLYGYVWNEPTGYTDPTGEFPWLPLVGCLIGGGSSAGDDWMAGRKIDWGAAAAGCAMGAFGGFGARAAAAAAAKGAGRRAAAGAGRRAAANPKGPALPDGAWSKNAPRQVTPGTKQVEQVKYNPTTGQAERSTAYYDKYGRQTGRTDWTDHGRPGAHSNPHHHTTKYGPGYGPKGFESGPLPGPYRGGGQ